MAQRWREAGSLVLSTQATAAFGLVNSVLVLRMIGLEGFAVLALVQAFVFTLSTTCNSHSWLTLIKFYQPSAPRSVESLSVLRHCLRADTFSILLAAGVAGLALWGLPQMLDWPALWQPFAALYCLTLVPGLLTNTATGVLRAQGHFYLLSLHRAVFPFLLLLTLAVLFWQGAAGVEAVLWSYILWRFAEHFSMLALGIWAWRRAEAAGDSIGIPLPLSLWPFTLQAAGQQILTTLPQQVDTLLVGTVLGAEAAGPYRLFKNVGQLFQTLTLPLREYLYTLTAGQDRTRGSVPLGKALRLTGGLAFAVLGVLSLGMGPLLWLLTGSAQPDLIAPALVYCLATALTLAATPLMPALLAHGQQKTYLIHKSTIVFTSLGLSCLLGLNYGLFGFLAALVLGQLVYYGHFYRMARMVL